MIHQGIIEGDMSRRQQESGSSPSDFLNQANMPGQIAGRVFLINTHQSDSGNCGIFLLLLAKYFFYFFGIFSVNG
jgi:hypothetical protein